MLLLFRMGLRLQHSCGRQEKQRGLEVLFKVRHMVKGLLTCTPQYTGCHVHFERLSRLALSFDKLRLSMQQPY